MNDALLFAGRDQRKAGLPAEMLEQLDALGKSVNDPAFAEAKLDEALTVRWLSARTGRGAREIEAMLPSVVANYFGADMTASQAYDRIVATEAAAAQGLAYEDTVLRQERAVEEAPGQAQQRQASPAAERDEVKYPGWQTPRALGAGFQEFALNVPQGLFSAAAGVLGERMPDMVDPMMDAETYRLAREAFNAEQAREQERRLSGFDPGFDEAGRTAIDAYGAALARINEANKARLDEWRKTEADGTLRKVATFWKDLADSTDERWGVDPAFAVTGYGQFVKGVGSMPATSALMAVGAVGLLGIGGATFSGVESARMDYEGEAYDPKAALFTNFLNAGGQTIIEKIIKLDGVLEKALENTAKSGGRVRLPDYLRSVARTAVGEGIEEVAQGQWDDVVATAAYDEERGAIPFIDEGVAKRRFWEFMAGAGGGAIMGSTFGGALAFDQNRAARKAGEYLTNRMGGLLNEFDAKQVRRAFTDEEIRKMKDGETLLRAVNGDAAALSAYNKGVAAEKFINLKGASYGGVTLGEVDGRPAILKEDGSVLVVDVSSPEAAKAWEDRVAVVVKMAAIAEEERAAREAAVSSLIDYITARHAERDQSGELKITRDVENRSLVDQVGSLEEAERVYASYVASGALPAGLDVRKLGPQGTSDSPWNPVTKRWDVAIEIMKGAQPTVVIEESVEDFIKRQLDTEELTIDRVMAWRAEVEGAENTLDKRGAIEWVSKYAVAYATGKAQEGDVRLPSAFRAFLERFAKFVREALELGKKLLDMERAGEIPADFLRLLQESTGTVAEKERGAREPVPMASEVDAEMLAEAMNQDDFPKIEKTEAGSFVVTAPDGRVLATMDTVEAAQDRAMAWYFAQEQAAERAAAREGAGEVAGNELMDVVRRLGGLLAASKEGTMRGELKAIAENLGTAGKLRTFRKDAMDLDRLREALAEQGFDYDTPAAMLDAMERSTRGEAQYPRGAGGQTFSLGRAVPADASNVVEMPDGVKMVGPTTFSIKPDYGIQHRPNEEGPRAFDLSEGGLMPADVYEHPEWYSAMPPKVVRETATQLRKIRGKADALVTIYRAGPVGEMNPGDWISLSKEYARTHAESQDPDGFKVWAAKVAAKDVRWAMDDLAEFGYFGEKVAAQDSGVTFSLVAYHGTPHKVDKFSMAKIGTGEGAQAYGWGLYFAQNKGVADTYRKGMSPEFETPKGRVKFEDMDFSDEAFAADFVNRSDGNFSEALNAAEIFAKQSPDFKQAGNIVALLKKWSAEGWRYVKPLGNLYTVELLPDADEFLDWDAPLSGQSEKVKAALDAYINGLSVDERERFNYQDSSQVSNYRNKQISGAAFYNRFHAPTASRKLAALGIPGIRYLDGQSRQRPLRQIKAEFLGLLPEDADFESLMAEVEAGRFNPEQTAFLRALADSDWLGFDYPAQAISAALSDQITNYETTPELLASIEPLRGEVTRNYVIFDEKLVRILEENGRKVEQGQGETFSLSGERAVLRVDEHGKNIVWEKGDAFITVDDADAAGYIALWVDGRRVGELTTRRHPGEKDWLGIASVEINQRHRGAGYGTEMYRQALRFISPKYKGLVSYLPDQANKTQVPAIYKRLGGYVSGDFAYLPRVTGAGTFSLAQTETPAFKAWFKDSKVVDAQGRPLVVYHGTTSDVSEFDPSTVGRNYDARFGEVGFHFISDPKYASEYTRNEDFEFVAGGNVVPVFLKAENPMVVESPWFIDEAPATFDETATELLEKAQANGHDSILIKDSKRQHWVVFEPTQIKSATGNRGTFDPTNPDITANLFYENQGGQEASPEMQELQKKGDELDEVLAKYGRLYTNEVGKAALVRMRDEGYLAAIDAGQVALRQSRKAGGQLSRLALPADFRAGRIIPEVGRMLRERTLAAGMKATEDNEKVVALYVAAKRAGMTTGDLADLDHALNNGHKDVADAYAKKFGILAQLDAVRAVFEAQMAEALELGVPPGKFFNGELDEETTKKLRDAMGQAKSLPAGEAGRAMIAILEAAGMKRNVASYWPRKVLNRDALLMTLGLPGLRDEFDKLLDKAIEEAKGAGRALTEQEMDALVDQANANLQRKRFESGRKTPGALKARVIETITKEQMVHYYKGIDAAMKHNTAMREYLETLRMFGKSVVFEPSGAEFEVLPINVTSSVGAWVVDYALKGGISSEQRRELESIVIARFSYKATPSFYAGLRSFSYLQNLTQVTTFLTATIADTWTGFYASGGSPFRYGKNFVKAMQGLSKISAMDVGLDPSRITAEYEALEGLDPTFKEAARGLFSNILTEQGRAEWTPSQALQRLFGWFANKVGLRYFERVTREAHINSAVDYLIAQAKAGTLPRKLQRNLVRYFGEEKAAQVVADMKAGKADDADVKFYAFNALADWKAVSLDQMPESYLSSPKGRVFYMYKTWIAAQFAGIYHEAGQDIASGEPKRVISGVTTMVYLAALMLSVGLPVDAIVSWVQGRPFILQDSVVNRLLGAVGAGRYVASKVTRGELKDAAMEFFAPPLGGALGDLQDDAEAIYYLGTDLDAMKLKTWRNLPGFGRVINGYLGFKSEANAEARETAGGWIALTDGEEPKKTAEELEEMKRARLAKEYSVK